MGQAPTSGRHSGAWTGRRLFCVNPGGPFRVNMALSLFVSVVDNSSNWAVCGKSSGVISMPVTAQATHRVHMEVMPLFAGYLPLPDVRLFKYLPHHSAQSSQLDAGRDPGNGRSTPSAQGVWQLCAVQQPHTRNQGALIPNTWSGSLVLGPCSRG